MRRAARVVTAVTASVLLGTTLNACGEGDPFEVYCAEVESQQTAITEAVAGGGATALLDALPSFESLQDVAPDDISDEWSTVTRRISVLRDALDDAGLDPATFDREDPPDDLTEAQQAQIDAAARELASPAMEAALGGVQQQARDVCKMPLGL